MFHAHQRTVASRRANLGRSRYFAYSDPTYRIEPSHGCIAFEGRGQASLLREKDEHAGLVINPGGPATCELTPADLSELASES